MFDVFLLSPMPTCIDKIQLFAIHHAELDEFY